MAALPYPFKGAPRFVVDSEGVVTDQRAAFIKGVTALFEEDLTDRLTYWPKSPYDRPVMLDFDEYRKATADPEAYADEPVRKIEFNRLTTFPTIDEAWIDEVSTFDQEMLDNLIARTQREKRNRVLNQSNVYDPPYDNPDCCAGYRGCSCRLFRPGKRSS